MSRPTAISPEEQEQIARQIGVLLLQAVPEDWQQITVEYRATGEYHDLLGEITKEDGTTGPWEPPADLPGMFEHLREGMYRPDVGTWLSALYVVERPSAYRIDINFDSEPSWQQQLPRTAYAEELRRYPRAEENVPEWMWAKLDGSDTGADTDIPPTTDALGQVPGSSAAAEADADPAVDAAPEQTPAVPDALTGLPAAVADTDAPQGEQPRAEPNAELDRDLVDAVAPETMSAPTPVAAEHDERADLAAATPEPAPELGTEVNHDDPADPAASLPGDTPVHQHVAEVFVAEVFADVDDQGRPMLSGRPPVPLEEVSALRHYLETAPLVQRTAEHHDELDPQRPVNVPGTWHTDGTWLWPGAVPYYLAQYGVPPQPELLGHVRERAFTVPEVTEETVRTAGAFLEGTELDDIPRDLADLGPTGADVPAGEATSDDVSGTGTALEDTGERLDGNDTMLDETHAADAPPLGVEMNVADEQHAAMAEDPVNGRENGAAPTARPAALSASAINEQDAAPDDPLTEQELGAQHTSSQWVGAGEPAVAVAPDAPAGTSPNTDEAHDPGAATPTSREPEIPEIDPEQVFMQLHDRLAAHQVGSDEYRVGSRSDSARCLLRDGSAWVVTEEDAEIRFARVDHAAAYLLGSLLLHRDIPYSAETAPDDGPSGTGSIGAPAEAPVGAPVEEPAAPDTLAAPAAAAEPLDNAEPAPVGIPKRAGGNPLFTANQASADSVSAAANGEDAEPGSAARPDAPMQPAVAQESAAPAPAPDLPNDQPHEPSAPGGAPVHPPQGPLGQGQPLPGQPPQGQPPQGQPPQGIAQALGGQPPANQPPANQPSAGQVPAGQNPAVGPGAGAQPPQPGQQGPSAPPLNNGASNAPPLPKRQPRPEGGVPPTPGPQGPGDPRGGAPNMNAPRQQAPVPPHAPDAGAPAQPPGGGQPPANQAPSGQAPSGQPAMGGPAGNQQFQPLSGEPPLTLYRDRRQVMLQPGTELDRFGEPGGNVTYVFRTPYSNRSLPPQWSNRAYHAYRVQRPLQVLRGTAVPWFEQPGGGTAYVLPASVHDLLADGVLAEIPANEAQRPPME